MYLEYFGLGEPPFSLTPDTRFFFSYGHYQDALNTLLVALRSGEGFIKVTGEVGTGKTLLCRKLLNGYEEEFYTAYIPNPFLGPEALVMAVAEELGLSLSPGVGQHRLIKEITRRLVALHGEGRQVVLCIDEAQTMPIETLEGLRLLTNIETEQHKLLQVVLFGQPELDERLADRSIRQLRQRITFSYNLKPIDRQGMETYVAHRLLVAGSNGQIRFAPRALRLLHRASGGVPRLVNVLAHKALMACYGQGRRLVNTGDVRRAVADTEGVRLPARLSWRLVVIVLLLCSGLALLAAFLPHLQRPGAT